MIKRFYRIVLLVFIFQIASNCDAQDDIYEYKPKSKFGLRLGLGLSAVRGGNLVNPTPYLGYAAGFYHHGKIKGRSYFYYELAARFKGSNFNTNPDSNTYSQMAMFYTELPIAYMLRVGKDEKKPLFLMAGGGTALLIKSSLALGPNPIPTYFDLPFKKADVFAMAGVHKLFGSVGLQVTAKWGLLDINNNNWAGLKGVRPNPDMGKPIKNWSVEFGLIF